MNNTLQMLKPFTKELKTICRGGKLYQWLQLIGHTSSFTVEREIEGAQGPLGSKRP